jgi:DNA-binding transcriptional ArsR family regulator
MKATPEKSLVYRAAAQICQALAHPKRYAIIEALMMGEKSATQLRKITDQSKSALTQNMHCLWTAGLINIISRGKFKSYTLAYDEIAGILEAIAKALSRRQASMKALQKEMPNV